MVFGPLFPYHKMLVVMNKNIGLTLQLPPFVLNIRWCYHCSEGLLICFVPLEVRVFVIYLLHHKIKFIIE